MTTSPVYEDYEDDGHKRYRYFHQLLDQYDLPVQVLLLQQDQKIIKSDGRSDGWIE